MKSLILFLLTALTCCGQLPRNWIDGDQTMLVVPRRSVVVNSPATNAPYVFETETLTYGAAITNNSGAILTNDFLAVDTFVKSAKNNGYWGYFVDLCPFAGETTNAAMVKLVYGSSFGNTNKVQNKGFIATDYTKPLGFTANGGGKYFDTKVDITNIIDVTKSPTNGMSVWLSNYPTNYPASDEGIFGINAGTAPNVGLRIESTAKELMLYGAYGNINTGTCPSYRTKLGYGQIGVTTTATNMQYGYQNGLVFVTNSTPVAMTLKSTPLSVFANGSVYKCNGKSIGFYEIDSGIPTNYLSSFYNDLFALETALGRTLPHKAYDQTTFLVIGQSLSVGSTANTSDTNFNLNTAAIGHGGQIANPATGTQLGWPRNTRTKLTENKNVEETGWRAFADHFYYLCTNNNVTHQEPLILNWGKGGSYYTNLSASGLPTFVRPEGTNNNYWFSTNDIRFQNTVQQSLMGDSIVIPAILCVHGEYDHANTSYDSNLAEWQSNYENDIRGITGKTNAIPLFITQHNSSMSYPFKDTSDIKMLTAHETAGGVILVGPKYQLIHGADGLHLTNISYRMMGEYYAEAVYEQVIAGHTWSPLRPISVSRSGAEITVTFDRGNLVFDTSLVSTVATSGFTYTDSSSPPAINSVVLAGATTNQIVITLASTPTGSSKVIGYAMNSTGTARAGPVDGPRGNLRDQSPAVGFVTTSNLYNWCVMFEKSAE